MRGPGRLQRNLPGFLLQRLRLTVSHNPTAADRPGHPDRPLRPSLDEPYLQKQICLHPHPSELMLRNHG